MQHAATVTADTVTAATVTADTHDRVTQPDQHAVKPSDDSQTQSSSVPAAVTSSLPSSSSSDSQQVHDVTPASSSAAAVKSCISDDSGAPANSLVPQPVIDSVSSTDQQADHTKSESVVVVPGPPERTSPSDASSNTKGSLLSLLYYHCMVLIV